MISRLQEPDLGRFLTVLSYYRDYKSQIKNDFSIQYHGIETTGVGYRTFSYYHIIETTGARYRTISYCAVMLSRLQEPAIEHFYVIGTTGATYRMVLHRSIMLSILQEPDIERLLTAVSCYRHYRSQL